MTSNDQKTSSAAAGPDQEARLTSAKSARRAARRLRQLFGKLDWDDAFDHKRERSRD